MKEPTKRTGEAKTKETKKVSYQIHMIEWFMDQ